MTASPSLPCRARIAAAAWGLRELVAEARPLGSEVHALLWVVVFSDRYGSSSVTTRPTGTAVLRLA